VNPTDQFRGDLGDGKARGLGASAEKRETRGFISMTTMARRPDDAELILEPPVSTPISRMMASEASRIRWYSLSVSVWRGPP